MLLPDSLGDEAIRRYLTAFQHICHCEEPKATKQSGGITA